jgi:NADH:ubiquinone reductase (H+-translocating)
MSSTAGSIRPSIVIVGAGFGGLSAARALAGTSANVTVVDRRNHHLFQPLLYQVATAALSPAEVAWPVRHLLRRQKNASVVLAEATAVNLDRREVVLGDRELPYDALILAPGNTTAYFGHDDWAAAAPGLKTLEDAVALRRRVLLAFERAEIAPEALDSARALTFVVVGGGPTGVEMAGAIAELARDALPREFRRIDTRSARVVLVEAGPRILPQLPEDLAAYAVGELAALGVDVRTAVRVVGVDEGGVELSEGRLDADTVVWAAGVATDALIRGLPLERDRQGRAVVGPDFSVPGRPEVFVIGDAAAMTDRDGRPVPGLAPAAKQAGGYVGRLLAHRFGSGRQPGLFRYKHAGNLATIGRSAAVVQFDGRLKLTGFVGWVFWSIAHVFFMIGVRNRVAVALDWVWSYLTRSRAARLITNA